MGNCFSVNDSTVKVQNIKEQKFVTSNRSKSSSNRSSRMINMSDFMGVKQSDSIENFYEIERPIGRGKSIQYLIILGAFGEVVKARHLFSNEYRAIKIIEKKKLQKHSILMQLQLQELNVLMKTDHPSLLKVHEILEDNGHYYIISELMNGGELYDRILKLKHFSERDVA